MSEWQVAGNLHAYSKHWEERITAARATDQQRITELEAEVARLRDESKELRRVADFYSPGSLHPISRLANTITQLRSALREAVEALEKEHAALDHYIEWNGAVHADECPQDDTCDCYGKEVNDEVDAAFTNTEDALARLRPLVDAKNDAQVRAIPGSESEPEKSGCNGKDKIKQ